MRDHILSHPMAGHLWNEKLQLDSNFPLFLSFKCEAVCSETKQGKEMRNYLKHSINVDNCSPKFRQNKPFPPQQQKIMNSFYEPMFQLTFPFVLSKSMAISQAATSQLSWTEPRVYTMPALSLVFLGAHQLHFLYTFISRPQPQMDSMPRVQTGPGEVKDQHKPILTMKETAQIQMTHPTCSSSTILTPLGIVTCPRQGYCKYPSDHALTRLTLRKRTAVSYRAASLDHAQSQVFHTHCFQSTHQSWEVK